mmetsp:Transcript_33682/g.106084  ORF Transcript_33682/g.106084 Transcript_33682/m.106084 type:complete len:347 (-) Transcript_33682:587-1627(-)
MRRGADERGPHGLRRLTASRGAASRARAALAGRAEATGSVDRPHRPERQLCSLRRVEQPARRVGQADAGAGCDERRARQGHACRRAGDAHLVGRRVRGGGAQSRGGPEVGLSRGPWRSVHARSPHRHLHARLVGEERDRRPVHRSSKVAERCCRFAPAVQQLRGGAVRAGVQGARAAARRLHRVVRAGGGRRRLLAGRHRELGTRGRHPRPSQPQAPLRGCARGRGGGRRVLWREPARAERNAPPAHLGRSVALGRERSVRGGDGGDDAARGRLGDVQRSRRRVHVLGLGGAWQLGHGDRGRGVLLGGVGVRRRAERVCRRHGDGAGDALGEGVVLGDQRVRRVGR